MAADWYLPLALIKTCDFCLKGIDRSLKKEKAIKLKSEEGALESLAWLVALLEIKGEVNVEAFGLELVISWDSSCQPLIMSVCKESVGLTLFLQDDLNRFVGEVFTKLFHPLCWQHSNKGLGGMEGDVETPHPLSGLLVRLNVTHSVSSVCLCSRNWNSAAIGSPLTGKPDLCDWMNQCHN